MSQITMSKDDLKDFAAAIASAVVMEANKPKPPTAQQLVEIEQAQQHRKDTAEDVNRKKVNARWFQEFGCSHEHSKQAGGGTHSVHVRDNDHQGDPGFILCQACQGRFRPDSEKWRKLDPDAIFDTAKFNKLFQDCAQIQGEIIG